MSKFKYILAILGGAVIGGLSLGGGAAYLTYKRALEKGMEEGYAQGLEEGQPKVGSADYNGDGNLEMCIKMYDGRAACTGDFDEDGLQDIVIFNKDLGVETIKFGKKGLSREIEFLFEEQGEE